MPYVRPKDKRWIHTCSGCKYQFSAEMDGKTYDFYVHRGDENRKGEVFAKTKEGEIFCGAYKVGRNAHVLDDDERGSLAAQAFYKWERGNR